MHKRTLFILPVIAGVLCLAFPVVPEQLGTPRLLPDGVNSLLGMVGMTVLCAALNILRRLSAPACRREQKALHDERNTAIQNKARAISGDITMLAVLLAGSAGSCLESSSAIFFCPLPCTAGSSGRCEEVLS